jgi:uncharacterized glyoxalase superfamily protein PhnB
MGQHHPADGRTVHFVLHCGADLRSNPAPSDMARKRKVNPNAVHLTVVSVPRAIKFYKEKLGFRLTRCFPDKDKPMWASMVLAGQAVMLGELPSLAEARQFGLDHDEIELLKQDARAFARGTVGAGAAYYLQVADVDVYAARLRKKRVRLLTQPKSQFYGIRDFQVADQEGYRLVFFSPVAASALPVAAAGDAPADNGGA